MICITIAQESRHLLLADMLNAVALGADMLEVRLDCLEKAPSFADMLSARRKPILFSCRRPQDGGNWQGSEEERLMLLRQAIMSKADYVEIEYDVAEQIRPFPGCQRVISYTNKEKMPTAIGEIYDDMLNLQPDIIKITVRARVPEEAWPLLKILGRQKVPTVVVGLGRPGLMLALLGRKLGAPWTQAALERGMETYPGEPTIADLVQIYRLRDIGKPTRFVGVTGVSEREFITAGLMNSAFVGNHVHHRVLPLTIGNYTLFHKIIDAVRLQAVVVNEQSYVHLHKLAQWDESAKTPVQAGDFLLPRDNGSWIASNTLASWVIQCLEEKLRVKEPESNDLFSGRVVMFAGVGPQARMLAQSFKSRGAALVFASKNRQEATRASQLFGGRVMAWEGIYATLHDILILESEHKDDEPALEQDELPLHPGYLKPTMTILDLSHMPRRSPFLEEAQLRGCSIVEPADLLIAQVCDHVQRLTGSSPDRTGIRSFAESLL